MRAALDLGEPEKPFRVSATARKIVDALFDVLDGAVSLHDGHERMLHLAMRDGDWWSFKLDKPEEPRKGAACVVEAPINDRWTLVVSSRRGLHPDAEALVNWAAKLLADHLPSATSDDAAVPPFGGDGGSGGSAEIGIPVWWARKARG